MSNLIEIENLSSRKKALQGWVDRQLRPWSSATTGGGWEMYQEFLRNIDENQHNIFIFDFVPGSVSVRSKTNPHIVPAPGSLEEIRVQLYLDFLDGVVKRYAIEERFSIALCVGDIVDERFEGPIFGFQKQAGSRTILLPDPDFMQFNYYEDVFDEAKFDEKLDEIIFCGSSTGRMLALDDVEENASERLRYAAHFNGSPNIIIKIGAAVQCLSEDARLALEAKSFFQSIGWIEQLRRKYILSMDGNGATCSRVILSLKSQSVLLKVSSTYQLYYFDGLRPFEHYIPVDDVAGLAALSQRLFEGAFDCKAIVARASAFYDEFLQKDSVEEYVYDLLAGFGKLAQTFR